MSPEELYTRLERKITERLKLARAAVADLEVNEPDGEWVHDVAMWRVRTRGGLSVVLSVVDAPRVYVYLRHIAANDPAHVIRACEADLETLAEHTPCSDGHSPAEVALAGDLMRGIRYQHDGPYCHRCLGPSPCVPLRRLGHVYGVDLEGTTP